MQTLLQIKAFPAPAAHIPKRSLRAKIIPSINSQSRHRRKHPVGMPSSIYCNPPSLLLLLLPNDLFAMQFGINSLLIVCEKEEHHRRPRRRRRPPFRFLSSFKRKGSCWDVLSFSFLAFKFCVISPYLTHTLCKDGFLTFKKVPRRCQLNGRCLCKTLLPIPSGIRCYVKFANLEEFSPPPVIFCAAARLRRRRMYRTVRTMTSRRRALDRGSTIYHNPMTMMNCGQSQ